MHINLPIILFTQRFVLKTLSVDEAQLLLNYYNRNKTHFESWSPLPDKDFYSMGFQQKKLQFDEDSMQKGRALRIWIFDKNDGSNIIGDISFTNIIRGPFQSCNVGYKTDVMHLRQGVMMECLKETCKYVFSELTLHRIEANIIPTNYPSIHLIKKSGFIEEGYAREYLHINGRWEDHIRFALIDDQNT